MGLLAFTTQLMVGGWARRGERLSWLLRILTHKLTKCANKNKNLMAIVDYRNHHSQGEAQRWQSTLARSRASNTKGNQVGGYVQAGGEGAFSQFGGKGTSHEHTLQFKLEMGPFYTPGLRNPRGERGLDGGCRSRRQRGPSRIPQKRVMSLDSGMDKDKFWHVTLRPGKTVRQW